MLQKLNVIVMECWVTVLTITVLGLTFIILFLNNIFL